MRFQPPSPHEVAFFAPDLHDPLPLPMFALSVECGASTTGFASPADDYIQASLSLDEYHNLKGHTTFLVRATGESMQDAGIAENDLMIVDTTLPYRDRDVVICCLNGSYKAKILHRDHGRFYLISRNAAFPPVEISEFDDFRVFGVVKGISRNFRRD